MVPTEGVEPTHPHGYQILSLARLPIPPHRPPIKSMLFTVSTLLFFSLHPTIAPRIFFICNPYSDQQQVSRKREEHLSNDGKWRSFPKVPHLLQYLTSGNYFGKVKINGKTIRKSLQTTVWTTAQLRLNDFLKEHRENRNKFDPPKFCEAVDLFKAELASDSTMKASSKEYRADCITKLQRTWPELWDLRLNEITAQACKDWAAKLNKEIASQYFNNMIGTLRLVIASWWRRTLNLFSVLIFSLQTSKSKI